MSIEYWGSIVWWLAPDIESGELSHQYQLDNTQYTRYHYIVWGLGKAITWSSPQTLEISSTTSLQSCVGFNNDFPREVYTSYLYEPAEANFLLIKNLDYPLD